MPKNRKTRTGTEGGLNEGKSLSDLEKDVGGAAPAAAVQTPQEAAGDEMSPAPSSDTPNTPSAAESAGNALSDPAPASAAPASVQNAKPKQDEPPQPRKKRSIRAGAIPLENFPNEYKGRDEEDTEYMKAEVVALALATRRLSIGLDRWDVTAKKSYIMPRWYALMHKAIFVIQGE